MKEKIEKEMIEQTTDDSELINQEFLDLIDEDDDFDEEIQLIQLDRQIIENCLDDYTI